MLFRSVSIGPSLASKAENLAGSILGNIFGKNDEMPETNAPAPCIINTTTYVL